MTEQADRIRARAEEIAAQRLADEMIASMAPKAEVIATMGDLRFMRVEPVAPAVPLFTATVDMPAGALVSVSPVRNALVRAPMSETHPTRARTEGDPKVFAEKVEWLKTHFLPRLRIVSNKALYTRAGELFRLYAAAARASGVKPMHTAAFSQFAPTVPGVCKDSRNVYNVQYTPPDPWLAPLRKATEGYGTFTVAQVLRALGPVRLNPRERLDGVMRELGFVYKETSRDLTGKIFAFVRD